MSNRLERLKLRLITLESSKDALDTKMWTRNEEYFLAERDEVIREIDEVIREIRKLSKKKQSEKKPSEQAPAVVDVMKLIQNKQQRTAIDVLKEIPIEDIEKLTINNDNKEIIEKFVDLYMRVGTPYHKIHSLSTKKVDKRNTEPLANAPAVDVMRLIQNEEQRTAIDVLQEIPIDDINQLIINQYDKEIIKKFVKSYKMEDHFRKIQLLLTNIQSIPRGGKQKRRRKSKAKKSRRKSTKQRKNKKRKTRRRSS